MSNLSYIALHLDSAALACSEFNDRQIACIFRAITAFMSGDEAEIARNTEDQAVRVLYQSMALQFRRDSERYASIVEKRRAAANSRYAVSKFVNGNDANTDMQNKQKYTNAGNCIQKLQMDANQSQSQSQSQKEDIKETYLKVGKEKEEKFGAYAPMTTNPSNAETSVHKIGKPVGQRQAEFRAKVSALADKYCATMLNAFCDYWTETNRSGTKMRCELEKTWSLEGRLATWKKRDDERMSGRLVRVPSKAKAAYDAGEEAKRMLRRIENL